MINRLRITFFASLPLGWRNWSFCFCDIDSLIGNSIWLPPPPGSSTVVFPDASDACTFRGFLCPVLALCSRSIYYLGQSPVLCKLIAIYVLFSFVEQLKRRKVKIFTDNQSAARELSFGGFKVLQSVALSTFHVCFCMVLPWKRSGYLDCSTEGWSFALFHLTRMIHKPIPPCFKSLKPNGVLAWILTVSHPIIECSASVFWLLVFFSWL